MRAFLGVHFFGGLRGILEADLGVYIGGLFWSIFRGLFEVVFYGVVLTEKCRRTSNPNNGWNKL